MAFHVGIAVYCVMQFIALVFIVVGTPIDMFRAKGVDTFGNKACLTLWGSKEKCYSTTYNTKPSELFAQCTERRDRFRAAEAFAIISIVVYGVAALLGFIQLCCCHCLRWICLMLNILGIFSCISWSLMADLYFKNTTSSVTWSASANCYRFSRDYKYGAGFALLIVGWALNFIAILFLAFPC